MTRGLLSAPLTPLTIEPTADQKYNLISNTVAYTPFLGFAD